MTETRSRTLAVFAVLLLGRHAPLGEHRRFARGLECFGEVVAARAQVALPGGARAGHGGLVVDLVRLSGHEGELRVELGESRVGGGDRRGRVVAAGAQRGLRPFEGGEVVEPAEALQLGRRTMDLVQQNFMATILVNSGAMLLGALGKINPLWAAVIHNTATLAVVLNSCRILRPQGRTLIRRCRAV